MNLQKASIPVISLSSSSRLMALVVVQPLQGPVELVPGEQDRHHRSGRQEVLRDAAQQERNLAA